jgi:hypothetical protein
MAEQNPNPNQSLDVIPLADSFLRAMQATEAMDKAVSDAGNSIKTFRIGLERAEPLRAIADTVTDVLKKQAVRDAAAQFRAAGKGKLDEATKNQIRETFDVAAEAMRDGTDNAFGRALKTLEIREEYARRLQDKTQKRIIIDNIKRSRKLLKEQSKNSVGFFGETMEDIRQNYLIPFVDKLDSTFFGRMLKRFAMDRLNDIRKAADERAKSAEAEARTNREAYEAEVEASNAAQNIRIAQDAEGAKLVQERMQTEYELAKAQGNIAKAEQIQAEQQAISAALEAKATQEEKVTTAKEQLVQAKISGDPQKIAEAEANMSQQLSARQTAEDEFQAKLKDAANRIGITNDEIDGIFIEARKRSLEQLLDESSSGNERIKQLYSNIADALKANPALNQEDLFRLITVNNGMGINEGLVSEIAKGNLSVDQGGQLVRGASPEAPMTVPPSPSEYDGSTPTEVVPIPLGSPETIGVLSNLLSQTQIMTRHLELSNDNLVKIALNTAYLQKPQIAATAATVVPTPTSPSDSLTAAAPKAIDAGPAAAGSVAAAGGVAVTVNMSGGTLGSLFADLKDRAMKFGSKIKENITGFASEAKKQATTFATDLGNAVIGPKKDEAQAQADTAKADQKTTEEAGKETQKPDNKLGFVQKLFGGGMFDKIKGVLASFKGGLTAAMKGLAEGLKSMFEALAEGLKKLADAKVLQGAIALAVIAIGLLAFAGAMYLFGMTNWGGAMIGIVVFIAFAVALAYLAPLLAPILPIMFVLADVLLLMSIALFVFAASMLVLGLAMQLFATVGLAGVGVLLLLLTGLAILSPFLILAGIALLIAAPGFFWFGAALFSLGLGMMMFASVGLSSLPVVLALLAGLAMIAPWLALAGVELIFASLGYFMFGAALIALGLGLQMFANVGLGNIATAIALLSILGLLSPLLLIASILLAVASVGFLLFGLSLISLGLGMQMFIGTAGAILPAIALLLALGLLAPLLYASSILLMLATPGFLLFGFALMALGAGLGAFAANAAGVLPAIATLAALAMLAPFLFVASIALGFSAPGFIMFGIAMMLLGTGLLMFSTGLLIFSTAISQISEGLLGLLSIIALMPLIALGIGAMVLLLMPLVLPMLLVGGALLLFAFAIMTFFKALAGGAQASLPSPEPAEATYNVAKMEIDNMPFSFPDFLINQQGGEPRIGAAETIVNMLNNAVQPAIINAGNINDGNGKLRNDENTFRRVQERFYNSALI